jgi:hypothetical protein
MRKSTLGDTPSEALITSTIEDVAEEIYRPSPQDRAHKAAFWARAAEHPLLDKETLSLITVHSLMGNAQVQKKSWSNPAYRSWFLNAEEHRDKLEYLFGLALDAAEHILLNDDPKAQSARVNMIKAIADLAGKSPKNAQVSPIAQAIGSMDKVQLEAYLQKNGVSLQLSASRDLTQVIDVSTETTSSSEKSS